MTRRALLSLGMMPLGARLTVVTGLALPWLGGRRSVVLSLRSTARKRSAIALSSTAARKLS